MGEETRKTLDVLWTPEQVAKYMTISRRTVYRWIHSKTIFNPDLIVKLHERAYRIPRCEVERIAGIKTKQIKEELNQNT